MGKNSRQRYNCDRGQRQENPDRAKNQSDCRIRYRALLEKNNITYYMTEKITNECTLIFTAAQIKN